MKVERDQLTPTEIRQRARDWYERQVEILALAHGTSWPEHKAWIESYLAEEVRQKLLARGWRLKD